MSDPNIKRPDLKDVVVALKDVTKWHNLGLHLGLSDATLVLIAKHDIEDHLRMMLSKWLSNDTEASWEKLADALSIIGEKMAAENIKRQFMEKISTLDVPGCRDDAKIRQAMTATALRKIKSRFSLLVIKVQSSMEEHKVKVKKVRQFLLNFFEGNCSIPDVTDLDKIFDTITEAKLWGYGHYGPLEELAESFLPEDDPARAQVTEYKSQLSGFYTTTSIIDFINLSEYEVTTEDDKLFVPKKYNSYYHKLTVELKLDRSVKLSELALDYVDKLWKALMQEFHLPPLTAVLDKIVEGSLRITWLILPHIMEKMKAACFKSIIFFERHNIVRIEIDDNFLLYDEELLSHPLSSWISHRSVNIIMNQSQQSSLSSSSDRSRRGHPQLHICDHKSCPLYKAPPCFYRCVVKLLSTSYCVGTKYPDWKEFTRYFGIDIPVSEEGTVRFWAN